MSSKNSACLRRIRAANKSNRRNSDRSAWVSCRTLRLITSRFFCTITPRRDACFVPQSRVHAEEPRLKIVVSIAIILLSFVARQTASAQSPVATLALSPDRIGEIKTAPGITTMIRFPDPVQEIICGDLYDPATGKGTFVIQRFRPPQHQTQETNRHLRARGRA